MSVGYGSGVGKERVIRWDLRSQAFGVHASAATFNDLSMGNPEMGHLGLGVAMTQSQVTDGANAIMGHLAENIYDLGAANATLGHTVAAPGQTQLQILVVVSDEQGHTGTPVVLTKNLPAVVAEMPHEATPNILSKVVLAANATQGHEGTALQMTLTVDSATMGHNGLAVAFGGDTANLTVVAGTMPHDGLGVEQFSPSQLADLVLWLAPDSVTSVTANRVAQWSDKSSFANHMTQVSASGMPLFVSAVANGYNIVEFDKNTAPLETRRLRSTVTAAVSAFATSVMQTRSGAIVVRVSAALSTQRYFTAGRSVNTGIHAQWLQNSNTGGYQYIVVTTGTTRSTNFAAVTAGAHLIRWEIVSSRGNFWLDGAVATAGANLSAATTDFSQGSFFTLGGTSDAVQGLGGWISEVVIGATAWTSSQGRELDKLLGAKYGITIT